MQLLVARGADVNGPAEPTSTGRSLTALRNAAHDGNMAFVRQLLDHDASDILTILQILWQFGNSEALDYFMGFAVWPTNFAVCCNSWLYSCRERAYTKRC